MKWLGISLVLVLPWVLAEGVWALWYEPFDMDKYQDLLRLTHEIQRWMEQRPAHE